MLPAVLSRIFSRKAEPKPEELLLTAFQATSVRPFNDFPLKLDREIPCERAGKTLISFYDQRHPVLSKFDQVIDEIDVGHRRIRLEDMTGCAASKTSTSFAYLAQLNWFAQTTEKNKHRREDLAEEVFGAQGDVKLRGQLTVKEQQWDGRRWFANSNGSHRSGAVWLLDRQNSNPRHLDCRVIEMHINQDFRKFCEAHSIFLFTIESGLPFLDVHPALKGSDLTFAADRTFFTSGKVNCCLVVPRDNPFYDDIALAVANGTDFSDWVLNPNNFTKYESHYLPAGNDGLTP